MRVGFLVVKVELTGDVRAPLRARLTERARLDRPETERVAHVATREDLHAHVDRWLDRVLLHRDEDTADRADGGAHDG